MKSIGGYFELELNNEGEYHKKLLRLNTARNALEYLLKAQNFRKIYIPYFTCDVILEPLKKLNIPFEFYNIDCKFEPIFNFDLVKESECFLYTNYFGIKDLYIHDLKTKIDNLIIDSAQSFFSKPLENIHTIYSPRKFFGVSDGAYLATNRLLDENLQNDISFDRMNHLLLRADLNAEEGYAEFCKNDSVLINNPIRSMSQLTQKILCSIDYTGVKEIRRKNFDFLDSKLKNKNLLNLKVSEDSIPMVYPFWSHKKDLKKVLLNNRIYCATYWPNVLEWCNDNDLEKVLTMEVVYLPIDQRYCEEDMKFIIQCINNALNDV